MRTDRLTADQPDRVRRAIVTVLLQRSAPLWQETYSMLAAVAFLARRHGNVAFVHSGERNARGHAITQQAQRSGSESILMPHGLIDYHAPELTYYPRGGWFAAWGDVMHEGLMRSPLSEFTKLVVLGDAHLESLLGLSNYSKGRASALPSAGSGKSMYTVLVVFGRPSRVIKRPRFEAAADEVFRAANAMPGAKFVIKVHPFDYSGYWSQRHAATGPANVRVTTSDDFYSLLQDAFVVVTMHSTAGAEAICAGRPVVVVDVGSGLDARLRPDYLTEGAAYSVDEPGGLADVLTRLLEGDDPLKSLRSRFADRFLYRNADPTPSRIATFLAARAGAGGGPSAPSR